MSHTSKSLHEKPVAPWITILSRERTTPLYRSVTQTLARQIEDGELSPGTLLPPEVELAKQLGVSRHTMRAGIEALVRAGRLERHRGRGTFVTRPPMQQNLSRFYTIAETMRAHGATLETQVLQRGRLHRGHRLALAACTALGLEEPRQVGYLQRLRVVDETPLLLEWVTFPADLCTGVLALPRDDAPDLGATPFYDVLSTQANIRVTTARETLRPVACTHGDARTLGIRGGTPVFQVERVSYAHDRPVEWRHTLIRGDRYTYIVELTNPATEDDTA